MILDFLNRLIAGLSKNLRNVVKREKLSTVGSVVEMPRAFPAEHVALQGVQFETAMHFLFVTLYFSLVCL